MGATGLQHHHNHLFEICNMYAYVAICHKVHCSQVSRCLTLLLLLLLLLLLTLVARLCLFVYLHPPDKCIVISSGHAAA